MLALLLLLVGCGPTKTSPVPKTLSVSPNSNVHLRNAFDMDPSTYLGRFVPDGQTQLDETAAMPLTCSQHITHRRVEGGGVRMTELLEISAAASARLGIPLVASASGSGSNKQVVRVNYELTGKLVAEVSDPEAFEDCCKNSPDQCASRYIGEFLEGTGTVYHESSRALDAEGSALAAASGANGDVVVSHGTQWQRGVEFPNPVFFAFKVTETPYRQQSASACASFGATLPPADANGLFVLGSTGTPAKDEATARRRALNNATMQSARAFGLSSETPESGASLPGVTAREWCVEQVQTQRGPRVVAKVLAKAVRPTAQPTPLPSRVGPVPAPASLAPAPAGPAAPAPHRPLSPPAAAPAVAAPAVGQRPATPHLQSAPGLVGAVVDPMPAEGEPLADTAFAQLQDRLAQVSFSDDKLAVLRAAAAMQTSLTVAQVAQLMGHLTMDDDKVEVATLLRARVADPENGAALAHAVTFSKSKLLILALFP